MTGNPIHPDEQRQTPVDRSKSSERMWPTEMPARVTLNGVRYVQQTVRSHTPPERDEWLEKLHEMNNDDSTKTRAYQAHLRFGFEKGYI